MKSVKGRQKHVDQQKYSLVQLVLKYVEIVILCNVMGKRNEVSILIQK
jgi:hypothetical protein